MCIHICLTTSLAEPGYPIKWIPRHVLISYHFIRGYGAWEARKSGKSGEVGSQDSQHVLASELAPLKPNRLTADTVGPSSRVCMNL